MKGSSPKPEILPNLPAGFVKSSIKRRNTLCYLLFNID